jgi:stage II sporulation protein R
MKKILNFLKKIKIKNIIILLILFFIYTFICAYSYANSISQDISNNIFRLHVIANSDSDEDQTLKYKVRDNLLSYMEELCKNCKTKDEAITLANENINTFKSIAIQTIKENGYDYTIEIEIGNFEFPTKQYGSTVFPSGYYDALRVKIGNANRSKLVVCDVSVIMLYRTHISKF